MHAGYNCTLYPVQIHIPSVKYFTILIYYALYFNILRSNSVIRGGFLCKSKAHAVLVQTGIPVHTNIHGYKSRFNSVTKDSRGLRVQGSKGLKARLLGIRSCVAVGNSE
jgi:hypothetical protein